MPEITLRTRIRKHKISPQKWSTYRGEIAQLCISGQALFANGGLSWDVLEIELKNEGWLFPCENLWDVLRSEKQLKRKKGKSYGMDTGDFPFDENWTEEDYVHFEKEILCSKADDIIPF